MSLLNLLLINFKSKMLERNSDLLVFIQVIQLYWYYRGNDY